MLWMLKELKEQNVKNKVCFKVHITGVIYGASYLLLDCTLIFKE